MIKREILVVVILALAALAGYYAYNSTPTPIENVSALDLTCGFTADFASFISLNSTNSLI